ncbi:MAG: hypothetical protein AAF297_08360 [Planctomycetota bacterium]
MRGERRGVPALLAGLGVGLAALCAPMAGAEPLFAHRAWADVVSEAARDEKLIVVYATSQLCPPCRAMEGTTFEDDALAAWLAEHAETVKITRDTMNGAPIDFRSAPQVVVMRGDQELGRAHGIWQPNELIRFFEVAESGVLVDADAAAAELDRRVTEARSIAAGDDADAAVRTAESYVWLWEHERVFDRDRELRPELVEEMAALAARSDDARSRFAMVFDRIGIDAGVTDASGWVSYGREGWLMLGVAVLDGDGDGAVVSWVDRFSEANVAAEIDPWYSFSPLIGHADLLKPLLVKYERWRVLGEAMGSGIDQLRRAERTYLESDQGEDARARLLTELGIQHAAHLAAGNDGDAWMVASIAGSLVSGEESSEAMVRAALRAESVTEAHRNMLPVGHELRPAIDAALGD